MLNECPRNEDGFYPFVKLMRDKKDFFPRTESFSIFEKKQFIHFRMEYQNMQYFFGMIYSENINA